MATEEVSPASPPAPIAEPAETVAPSAEPAATPPAEETKPDPVPVQTGPDPDTVRRAEFVRLARERAAVRARETATRSLEQDAQWARQVRDLARSDPQAALRAIGVDVETAARTALPPDPATETAARIKALEDETKAGREARILAERAQQIANGQTIVRDELSKTPEAFPRIMALGKQSDVFDLLAVMLHEHHVEMSIHDAAAEVEKDLEERIEKPLITAWQKREAARAGTSQQAGGESNGPGRAPTPTISSKLNGEGAERPPQPFDLERHRREVMAEFTRQ